MSSLFGCEGGGCICACVAGWRAERRDEGAHASMPFHRLAKYHSTVLWVWNQVRSVVGCLSDSSSIIIGMNAPPPSGPSSSLPLLFTPPPYLDLDFKRLHGGLGGHLKTEVAQL